MFPCSIAFVTRKTIVREILMKITHDMITSHLGDDRRSRNSRNTSISSYFVDDLYSFSSCHTILQLFLFAKFPKIISNIHFSNIESIIITTIYEYLERILRIHKLQKGEEDILHTLSIGLTDTNQIDCLCITVGEGILTLIAMLHSLYFCEESFVFLGREKLGIIESFEWAEESRRKRNIRHPASCNNRSCPWSTTSLVDTDDIVFLHGSGL